MKPSGFDIIELPKNNLKPETHAMNNNVTQATQNVLDKRTLNTLSKFSLLYVYYKLVTTKFQQNIFQSLMHLPLNFNF